MKKIILAITTIFISLTLFSCASVKEIPTDLTAAQIIQRGQNAYDLKDYNNAANCYKTVIQRYGIDVRVFLEGKYELGHVYLAQKKYDEAYNIFAEILDIYETTPAGDLPQAYKKLAQIGMSNIPDNKKPKTSNPSEAE